MQGSPIRWLHLSDFHVGKDNYAQRKLFEKIRDHVSEQVEASGAPDLVFVTGDLAQQGKPEEFTIFYEEFLFPLVEESLGKGWKGKIFTIPGNHDVQRDRNALFDRVKSCAPESRFFDPTSEGLQMRRIVLPRFDAYREGEKKALEVGLTNSPADWLGSISGAFHDLVEVHGHPIGIVGINTAWLCMDANDRHHLSPGFHLLEAALDALKACDARIVLGHHPLDWMHDEQVEGLRALLGKHGALYLHGHLHRSRGRQEEGAGSGYLAIQAGAGFQARDDEKWRNGLLWAELDLLTKELRLQPRSWSRDQQGWPLESSAFPERQRSGEWWVLPLPGTRKERRGLGPTSRPGSVPTLKGWQVVDRLFLDSRRRALSKEDALLFFDGSVPSWQLALAAEEIPRRRVVGQMVAKLSALPDSSPRVLLLVGPGGEGKSTAVLQTIVTLLEQDPQLRVLWREDEGHSLTPADVRALPSSVRWLIATDDADLMAKDLFEIVKALHAASRRDVGLLLTCRDTDWLAAGGEGLHWRSHSHFERVELSDLSADDARCIVVAWARQGAQGLGKLAGKNEQEAAQLLAEAATREAAQKERGAFFGAMLEVRLGEALRDHLKALLDRLGTKEREIHSGVTLLDAFGYVAAMHAEGLTFLSRPVLAKVLECDPGQLKAKVLAPLGKEAAAIGAGQYILTRHRAIARVAVELLSETLQWEIDDLYVELVRAAKAARSQTFIPGYASWEYALTEHFLGANRPDLAIRIGQAVLEADPDDDKSRSNLAKIFREIGAPEEASRLFREYEGKLGRGAYSEWGTVEGAAGNAIGSAWLVALSLADQAGGSPPDNQRAKLSLAGLGVAFGNLLEAYSDPIFRDARAAVGVLGLTLQLDATARGFFQKHLREARAQGAPEMTAATALESFEAAVRATGELCDPADPLAARLPLPGQLTFERLRSLLSHAAQG
jgi:calcineurin-like phosphoesterase family protein/tetratricopeptide (TPR) repeat protein